MSAREFAVAAHAAQTYGEGVPYSVHLDAVVAVLAWAGESRFEVIQAAYLHDVVEDTKISVREIEKEFGVTVGILVEAMTKPGKKTANRYPIYYAGLRAIPNAVQIKLADRIANAEACIADIDNEKSVKMLAKYRAEYPRFRKALKRPAEFARLWERLDAVMDYTPPPRVR